MQENFKLTKSRYNGVKKNSQVTSDSLVFLACFPKSSHFQLFSFKNAMRNNCSNHVNKIEQIFVGFIKLQFQLGYGTD